MRIRQQRKPRKISLGNRKRDTPDWVTARATLWLAILTGVLIIANCCLTVYAFQQVMISDKAVRVAEESAKDGHESLLDSQRNFREDQRPWIYTKPREDLYRRDSGQLTIHTDFFNSGKAPALNAEVKYVIVVGNPNYLEQQLASKFESKIKMTKITSLGSLPPSGNSALYSESSLFKLAPSILNALSLKDKSIALVGRIFYADTAREKYETTFCYLRLAVGAYQLCDSNNNME